MRSIGSAFRLLLSRCCFNTSHPAHHRREQMPGLGRSPPRRQSSGLLSGPGVLRSPRGLLVCVLLCHTRTSPWPHHTTRANTPSTVHWDSSTFSLCHDDTSSC